MIKIHYEVTHFYKIQNVVKTEFISIQARKEHIPRGEPRIFFFRYRLIGPLLGEGGYKRKSKGICFTKI